MMQLRYGIERLKCALARRLGLDVDLDHSAISVDEIYPGIRIERPPCVVLPGQCERITAGAFGIDVNQEIATLSGTPCNLAPTLRYEFRDVIIADGSVYSNGRQKMFNLDLQPRKNLWVERDEATLRSSRIGCYFFGEWLLHDCATHLLAEKVGLPSSMPAPDWPHKGGYLTLFQQQYEEIELARVKRLIVFDDLSQNPHKTRRLRELRSRLANNIGKGAKGSRVVFVTRGVTGQRRYLINEEEIAEALARRGAVIVQPEALTVSQLVKELLGAELIVGVEGSQLYHGIYSIRERGGILAIQPPDRFFNSSKDWARVLNMRYGFVVGQQADQGFHLPVDDLLRTMELMNQ